MMRAIAPAPHKLLTVRRTVAIVGFGLPILAAVVACIRALLVPLPIVIERPAALVVAAILTLAPLRRQSIEILQRVVVVYLLCIVVNEVHLQYVKIAILPLDIRIAGSALPLALLIAGWLADRRTSPGTQERDSPELLTGWLVAGGVILAHMAVLAVLLHVFYGYGYEEDIHVLGGFALYFLVFLACWRPLRQTRLRQAVGLVLTLFYAAAAALTA